jgi:hypothetical protein
MIKVYLFSLRFVKGNNIFVVGVMREIGDIFCAYLFEDSIGNGGLSGATAAGNTNDEWS